METVSQPIYAKDVDIVSYEQLANDAQFIGAEGKAPSK